MNKAKLSEIVDGLYREAEPLEDIINDNLNDLLTFTTNKGLAAFIQLEAKKAEINALETILELLDD